MRGVSFNKGCYPGQEIVERIRSRGHVNRKLAGFMAAADRALRPGMKISAGDREVGHLTSTAFSPGLQQHIALGYIRAEFADPGTQVTAEGIPMVVTALPFPR